jgi:hypothetical protein
LLDSKQTKKTIQYHSDVEIELTCGLASITLSPDGKITLKGTSIIQISDSNAIQASRVEIG